MDRKFCMSQQRALTAWKANSILGCINRRGQQAGRRLFHLCFALMRRHLEHCVQAWGPQQRRAVGLLERGQRRALR